MQGLGAQVTVVHWQAQEEERGRTKHIPNMQPLMPTNDATSLLPHTRLLRHRSTLSVGAGRCEEGGKLLHSRGQVRRRWSMCSKWSLTQQAGGNQISVKEGGG